MDGCFGPYYKYTVMVGLELYNKYNVMDGFGPYMYNKNTVMEGFGLCNK